MTILISGVTLVGPLFLPLSVILLTVYLFWTIRDKSKVKNDSVEAKEFNESIINSNKELNGSVLHVKGESYVDLKKSKIKPKVRSKTGCCVNDSECSDKKIITEIKIYYGSVGGTAKIFSEKLANLAREHEITVEIIDLSFYEPEDKLPFEVDCCNVFILSTYIDGSPPPSAQWFCRWLEEVSTDFKVQKGLLKNVKFAVFGLGNSIYGNDFNKVAINVDKYLQKLQGRRIKKLFLGDANSVESKVGSLEEDFNTWANDLIYVLLNPQKRKKLNCTCTGQKENKNYSDDETEKNIESSDEDDKKESTNGIIDVEDLGKQLLLNNKTNIEMKDMVTSQLRETLTKQGYQIIGTHSGVKLCRWTKSMLRGRGGCYKHTFYGIQSHQCMELTPSLACANKCVFCWRHHSNPVGTEWKWNMDSPELILNEALKNHYKMINQFKGAPGVSLDRLKEAMEAQHCALSLVGEPIMYPEINKFLQLLHQKKISSFLVTNAQFPNAIRDLIPVTQLYVSVDASSKESLKKIDRPLFKDFWERFISSLKALSEKNQRTVFRLTLVKAWNDEEFKNYAELVSLGKPDFIEIKGVTYCGTSKASNLTMENVPWHKEVVNFGEKLCSYLNNYKIASEHEHSNCILLANTKFLIDGKWYTWIDYNKFHYLINQYELSNGLKTFKSEDYKLETPFWAVYGAQEQGFDPSETRWRKYNSKSSNN